MNTNLLKAAARGALKGAVVGIVLYVAYLSLWFFMVAGCASTQPDWRGCGDNLMTDGARFLLSPFTHGN